MLMNPLTLQALVFIPLDVCAHCPLIFNLIDGGSENDSFTLLGDITFINTEACSQ